MYSADAIDNLIQPLLIRQSQIEGVVLQTIANRLKQIGTMTPSDIYTLERLLKTGNDAKKINKRIAELTKLSEKDIKTIIRNVAKDSYTDSKPFYDYRHKSFIPFEDNIEIQRVVKAVQKVTLDEFKGISNTTAFMLRDLSNPLLLKPTKLSKVYNIVIDTAIQSVVTGMDSYNQVIPKIIQQLTDSGIKTVDFITEDGKKHFVRLDAVVKRNILDGIKYVQQEVQNVTGKQFGADGVELSVHQFSAPDHEPVQGHQFSMEEFDKMQLGKDFQDVNGKKFKGFDRPIGMWHCRHFAWNIIIGHKTPNYTYEQLEAMKQKNANGIITKNKSGNDVTRSMYWCTQKRNSYELQLKQLKEAEAMAKKANQDNLATKYNNKVIAKQDEYVAFCKKCKLNTRFENTRIFI